MMVQKRRDTFDILEAILGSFLTADSLSRSQVVVTSKLSWKCSEQYFGRLIQRGFIAETQNNGLGRHSKAPHFKMTPKGREVLQFIKEFNH